MFMCSLVCYVALLTMPFSSFSLGKPKNAFTCVRVAITWFFFEISLQNLKFGLQITWISYFSYNIFANTIDISKRLKPFLKRLEPFILNGCGPSDAFSPSYGRIPMWNSKIWSFHWKWLWIEGLVCCGL